LRLIGELYEAAAQFRQADFDCFDGVLAKTAFWLNSTISLPIDGADQSAAWNTPLTFVEDFLRFETSGGLRVGLFM